MRPAIGNSEPAVFTILHDLIAVFETWVDVFPHEQYSP